MHRMQPTVLVLLVATTTAQFGCSGGIELEPTLCRQKDENNQFYCNAFSIGIGDIVPLQVIVRNKCSYFTGSADVYVPAKLQTGKMVQVVLACLDHTCTDFRDHLFEYTGHFEPGRDPDDQQLLEEWKATDRSTPRPEIGYLDGRVNFTMGPPPGFTGIDRCSPSQFPDKDLNKACGYFEVLDDVRARHAPPPTPPPPPTRTTVCVRALAPDLVDTRAADRLRERRQRREPRLRSLASPPR